MRLDIGDGNCDNSETGNNYCPTSGVEFLSVAHAGAKFHEIVLHGNSRNAVEVGVERRDGGSSDGRDDESAYAERKLRRDEVWEHGIRLQQLGTGCGINDCRVGR